MFYHPKEGHGLPHNPFNAIVAPRPIAWVSSRSEDGIDNLAPYSFFNAIAYEPPQIMFSSSSRKDSLNNIETTGVFAVNLVGRPMVDVMNISSGPVAADIDEFDLAGVRKADCATIACPRVLDAPATLECKLSQVVRLAGSDNHMVIGEVIGVHMRDDCIKDGRFDVTAAQLVSRLGYRDYAQVTDVFELSRPKNR
ncbi:flavin reductase (DIM6/NTAB) family NADH-FMN oxidoreductase RutF [Pacificibacter maritimus]|uniref:Flavin reductase (DIM6/NTAB) family NADH-FMN oxidoreductase RutF n=1 Tax=Pacificibacter maritimus TaxID=762213 RepID=A0A3N4UZM4_9RHOB|nr:flavin reductase family protein [Pacificibacter maritimus]RPE67040.1 flavin reductase (DIM6/NTAB) family NADH-FMN oxidoreductase RutF [Pacificibacter maritimus]